MNKVDIIGTLGPCLCEEIQMEKVIKAGLSIFRINNSHMSDSFFEKIFQSLNQLSIKGYKFKVLFDTQGPEIRIGELLHSIDLIKDQTVSFFSGETQNEVNKIPINFKDIMKYVTIGDRFFINDGKIELFIQEKSESGFTARVSRGGLLDSKKGMNFPDKDIQQSILSQKDRVFLERIAKNKHRIDELALSFVSSKKEILEVKNYLIATNLKPHIIAKIENKRAIEKMDEILEVADGIMVARGDLAVEIGTVKVPYIQKEIVRKANEKNKYAIVATQILDSMEQHSAPTRAEVSDATNAILDGANALMLSGETAIGKYPYESVATLNNIISYHSHLAV